MKSIQIRDIKEGDLLAYYRVFEQFHQKLYRYVYEYTGSAYYAEETVQLSFIKLWEKRAGLSEQFSISTQLFRIAKSTLIDLMRREKIRYTQELSDTFVSEMAEDDRLLRKEELRLVLSSIEALPEKTREVFKLSRFNRLSHKEISAQISISPKTIETHISKALKYLRRGLAVFL